LFFSEDSIRIYNDDLLTTKHIPSESIDLIVTSPPYSVDIKYGKYNDGIPYPAYLKFSEKWLKRCLGLAKNDGRLCLNIPLDKNKGGQQSVYADVLSIAKKVGWKYHTTIIWNEQNISRRTAWGSWLSASAPFIISPVEVIVVMYKSSWKKKSGSKVSDMSREEFIEWTNGVWSHGDGETSANQDEPSSMIWSFNGESKKRVGHPAPFPVELPTRCVKMFSFVDDVVLDPFMGSGSTLVACKQCKRKGIGIEIDRSYCTIAKKRIVLLRKEKPKVRN
jgi:site-specific DNA-methyltransferase (adenine-specific)